MQFMIWFYIYNFSSLFDLMLTRPFHYLGGRAPLQGAQCIVELYYTKVHGALRVVEIQITEDNHE